jgi:large subunit ribosomal protein L6
LIGNLNYFSGGENLSRIGKKMIPIPKNVTVSVKDGRVNVQGPLGKLERSFSKMNITVENNEVHVRPMADDINLSNIWGLTRTLIRNMILGVSAGFTESLSVVGMGYKIEEKGKSLLFHVGFCKPYQVDLPEGVTAKITDDKQSIVVLRSISKENLSQLAADIRAIRPPEPYKGKGILYTGEHIKRKAGKAGTAAAGGGAKQ